MSSLIATRYGALHVKNYSNLDSPRLPTLFIHGAGGSYLDFPSALRRSARVNGIAFDLPAHGASQGAAHEQVEDYAQAVLALLDALHLPQVILAGHSMGGAIALTLALLAPERVAGLMLIGTAAAIPVNPSLIEGILQDPQATAEQVMRWSWAKRTDTSVLALGVKRLLQNPPEVIRQDYLACSRYDVRERLGEIQVPTLVLAARDDRMIFLASSSALAQDITGAELVIVEGGGHMFPLEQPTFITQTIEDWLARHFPDA